MRHRLDLVDKLRRRKPPGKEFEENHWRDVDGLCWRCYGTVSRLYKVLNSLDADEVEGQSSRRSWNIDAPAVTTLRAHISFHSRAMQMSLQSFHL